MNLFWVYLSIGRLFKACTRNPFGGDASNHQYRLGNTESLTLQLKYFQYDVQKTELL